jgi:hypothetical protein
MTTTRRRLFSRLFSRTRNSDRHEKRRRLFRPLVEQLEDRWLLAVGILGAQGSVAGGFSNGTSQSVMVPAGNDRLLTFHSAVDQSNVTGVTYDGVAMTEAVGLGTASGSNARLWTLPLGTGPAINGSFVISTSGPSVLGTLSWVALAGVNQVNPVDSTNQTTVGVGVSNSSLPIASESGDLVLDAITVTSSNSLPSLSAGPGQSPFGGGGGGASGFFTVGGASRKSGAAPSQTMIWAITNNLATESGAHVAANINQVHPAEMNVVGNGMSIADGDTTPSLSDHTDFGSVDIATGLVTRTFTIENLNSAGDAPLNLTGTPRVQLSGAGAASFSVTTLPSATVGPASSTTFQIQFDPSTIGTKSATVSIANDDSNENPYDFAIQGTGTADSTVTQVGGLVTVTGGGIHNDLTINVSGGNLRIIDTGGSLGAGTGTTQASNNLVTIPIGSVSSIVVNGNGGNDTLQIDNDDTDQVTANITFHGGAGDDALQVLGGTATDIVYTPNAGSGDTARGTIELDSQTITFTGLEPTLVTTSAATVTIDLSSLAVSEIVTLSDGGGAGQSQVTFANNALEDLVFTNPTALLEVIGTGGAAHTINVQGLDAAFDADLTINGGNDDTVNFQTNPTDLDTGTLLVTGNTITLSQNVSSEGASLSAQNAVSLNGTSTLDAGAGTVSILANQDGAGVEGFSQSAGSAIVTTSNSISAVTVQVGGMGPAALGAVSAGTTSGRVTVTAGGPITDTNGATTNITADDAVLSAGGAIAALNLRLQLNVDTVTATNTSGDIGLEKVSGDLTVINIASGSGGSVRIDAPTGDLHVGTVSAAFNVILLAPTGSVTDTNGPGFNNVTSATVESLSSTGIDLDVSSQISGGGFDATGTGDILVRRPTGNLLISGGGIDAANGDISATALNGSVMFNTAIIAGGNHTVTLGATSNVTMLAGATVTSGGGVDVSAGGDITVLAITADANTVNGGTDAIKLSTATGNVTVNGALTATAAANLNIDIDPVDVFINANLTATGAVSISATNNIQICCGAIVHSDSDSDGTGDMTITADSDTSGAGNLTMIGATINAGAALIDIKGVNLQTNSLLTASTSPASVTIDATGTVNTGGGGAGIQSSGGVTINATDTVTVSSNGIDTSTGAGNVSITSTVGGVTVTDGGIDTGNGGAVTIMAAGNVPISSGGIIATGGSGGGNVSVTSSGGTVSVAGAGIVTNSGGGIAIAANGAVTFSTVVTAASGGTVDSDISISSTTSSVTLSTGTIATGGGGAISIVAAGNVNLGSGGANAAAVSGGGDVSIVSSSGGITTSSGGVQAGDGGSIVMTAAGNVNTSGAGVNSANGAGGGDIWITSTGGSVTTTNVGVQAGSGGSIAITAATGASAQDAGWNATNGSGGGNISATVSAGGITINGPVTTNGAGTISLDAGGATSDIDINAPVSSASGSIDLVADNDVNINPPGIFSTSGNVTVTADDAAGNNGGAISMADGALIQAGSGNIDLNADGNITLGGLWTSGAVTADSTSGSILDGGDTLQDINAPTAVLNAAVAVGSPADPLDVWLANLEGSAGAGGFFVDNWGDLVIGGITAANDPYGVVTTGGDIEVYVYGGNLTVSETVDSNGGNIELETGIAVASGHIHINAPVLSGGGDVEVAADGDITFSAAGSIDGETGAPLVELFADDDGNFAGGIYMTDGSEVDAAGGTIDVDAYDDILLSSLETTGAVTVDSSNGSILDNGDADTDIIAASAVITAGNGTVGIGANALDTALANLEGSATGGFWLTNTGDLVIGGISATEGVSAGGDVVITANSALDVAEDVVSTGGLVLLTATDSAGGGDDLTVRSDVLVRSHTSTVELQAGTT